MLADNGSCPAGPRLESLVSVTLAAVPSTDSRGGTFDGAVTA